MAPHAFLRAVREDPQSKGLLFAGTELGVYVSFDDGDHWQSLQLNLPVTSVRDLTIHGEDLIVATHGRSFWILDNITPLRQASDVKKTKTFWLYHPAPAFRIDNDSFVGTPLPPEEPAAENPPAGAMIDYFLKSQASKVSLEILDAQQQVVRRFSSEDHRAEKHSPLPIAERWFPKPEVLETTAGMHRFVWNLTWSSSGGPGVDEESEYRNPSGPKVAPGNFQLRLTVDGVVQSQTLKVIMDPRSPATTEILEKQLQLGRQIFAETVEARRTLTEIASIQKRLADIEQNLGGQNPTLKSALAGALSEISTLLNKKVAPEAEVGLQGAFTDLASALHVVESGDRAVPSQAIAVYKESSQRVKAGIAAWTTFKQSSLIQLNQKLKEANIAAIAISEIEQEVEVLMSR
jgi:hypothetical protein